LKIGKGKFQVVFDKGQMTRLNFFGRKKKKRELCVKIGGHLQDQRLVSGYRSWGTEMLSPALPEHNLTSVPSGAACPCLYHLWQPDPEGHTLPFYPSLSS
jgi:hypothetical protein